MSSGKKKSKAATESAAEALAGAAAGAGSELPHEGTGPVIPDAQLPHDPGFDGAGGGGTTTTMVLQPISTLPQQVDTLLITAERETTHAQEALRRAAEINDQKLSENNAERQRLEGERDKISERLGMFGMQQRQQATAGVEAPKHRGRVKGSKNKPKMVAAPQKMAVKSAPVAKAGQVDGRTKGGLNKTAAVEKVMKGLSTPSPADSIFRLINKAHKGRVTRGDMISALQALRRRGVVKVTGKQRAYKYKHVGA